MDTSNVREDDWQDKLIDYTLGAMDPSDAAAFEIRLAECRQHVLLANQYEQTLGWMGLTTQAVDPPSGHKSRLLSRLQTTQQESGNTASQVNVAMADRASTSTGRPMLRALPPQENLAEETAPTVSASPEQKVVKLDDYRERRRNSLVMAMGAIAASLILVAGLWAFLGRGSNALTIPPGYRTAQLAPQADFPGVNMTVLYHPDQREAVLLADGLPNLPVGKVYELWILPIEGNPINAGVFSPTGEGSGQHRTTAPQTVSSYAGFAVTIENAPGVDAPLGPAVAVGQFAIP